VVADGDGMRVRNPLLSRTVHWHEIQGFRLRPHTLGFSLSSFGLPGSTIVATLRSGREVKLGATLSVNGVDRTPEGRPLAEAWVREFEVLRPS
jgi:hypothetical protein